MKLIYCPECGDIRRLGHVIVKCMCGKSSGHYEKDGIHAVIYGEAIPIGFDNISFIMAKSMLYSEFGGVTSIPFDAFFIEKDCKTIINK